jgi:hypothetical protein
MSMPSLAPKSAVARTVAPADVSRVAGPLSWFLPAYLVMAVAGASRLVDNVGPLRDIDIYWHVIIGRQILATHHVAGAGATFSFVSTHLDWKSSEWLSEVILAETQRVFGWRGLIALRLLLSAVALVALALVLVRRDRESSEKRSGWPLALVFCLSAVLASALFQIRPELFSLLFLIWLAAQLPRWLSGGTPRWPLIPLVIVWANLHGYWILVPAMLGLAALGSLMDGRTRPARAQALWAVGAAAAGCVTPIGPTGLLLPLRLRAATSVITEWQPTVLPSPEGVMLGVLFVLILVAWARAGQRVPRAEILAVLSLAAFAGLAFRDVYVVSVLLAPCALPRVGQVLSFPRPTVGRREGTLFASVAVVTIVGALGWAAVGGARTAVFPKTQPVAIARYLARQPGWHRVVNDYNTSGVLIAFGGPHTQVAVDGRADRYGAPYLSEYMNMFALRGDWLQKFHRFHATDVVAARNGPLVYGLRSIGWHIVMSDAGYVLLEPAATVPPTA